MHRGYLGPAEQGWLAGVSAADTEFYDRVSVLFSEVSLPKLLEPIPASSMIYILGFQGGIDQFVTPTTPYSSISDGNFSSRRIVPPGDPCDESAHLINCLIKSVASDDSRRAAAKALNFIHDLIVGMKNRAAVINVSGLPSQDEVRESLPPDLALPVCRVLASIATTEELLPAPKYLLEKEPLKRFDELLNSSLYSTYTSAHLAIEAEVKPGAFESLRHYGYKLLQQGGEFLFNRRVTLNILPIASQLIDVGFGKLPGELARVASESAQKYASDRRNIVIYQFEDCMRSYLSDKLVHVLCKVVREPDVISYLLRKQNKG